MAICEITLLRAVLARILRLSPQPPNLAPPPTPGGVLFLRRATVSAARDYGALNSRIFFIPTDESRSPERYGGRARNCRYAFWAPHPLTRVELHQKQGKTGTHGVRERRSSRIMLG
jgi:hypothetical protein